MTVANGQLANETTFNDAFMSRTSNTSTNGQVDLLNPAPASGANILNIQKNINALANAMGISPNQAAAYLIAWANDDVGLSESSAKAKIEALVLKLKGTSTDGGHTHSGVNGDGAKIPAANVTTTNPSYNSVEAYLTGLSNGVQFSRSTGLLWGGYLNINADNTKFDINVGAGEILDLTTLSAPAVTNVPIAATTAITVTNLASAKCTYVMVDSTGAVIQQTTYPTPTQQRQNIFIGRLDHSNNTNITRVVQMPNYKPANLNILFDFLDAVAPFKIDGLKLSSNGANLKLNISSGNGFYKNAGYPTTINNPNVFSFAAATAKVFRKMSRVTVTDSADVDVVDPTQYDNAGTLTAVPAAGNATIQRLFMLPDGTLRIQYGPGYYTNLSAAVTALADETFVANPLVKGAMVLLGFLVVTKDATDLSNTAKAKFINAGRFEQAGTGAGGSGESAAMLTTAFAPGLGLTITIPDVQRQVIEVEGSTDPGTFNISNPTRDNQELYIRGSDQTYTKIPTLPNGGNVMSNGDTSFPYGRMELFIGKLSTGIWTRNGGW